MILMINTLLFMFSLLHSIVHKVAGSCACGRSAHSGAGHMHSVRRLLLLLLSHLWTLWGEGLSLPLKLPDHQVSHSFHHHSRIGDISAVS